MAQNKLNIPSSFGGIVRYSEEYESRLKLKPEQVVLLIILVVIFVLGLKIISKF